MSYCVLRLRADILLHHFHHCVADGVEGLSVTHGHSLRGATWESHFLIRLKASKTKEVIIMLYGFVKDVLYHIIYHFVIHKYVHAHAQKPLNLHGTISFSLRSLTSPLISSQKVTFEKHENRNKPTINKKCTCTKSLRLGSFQRTNQLVKPN